MPSLEYLAQNSDTYTSAFEIDESFDAILMRIMFVDFSTYGFKQIVDQTNILSLTDTGNYRLIDYLNGPTEISHIDEIRLTVYNDGEAINYMIIHMLDVYLRRVTASSDTGWITKSALADRIYIGNISPSNPNPSSIWIDNTIQDFPIFFFYNSSEEWISIGSLFDAITKVIYDEDGVEEDIFEYFDRKYGIPTVNDPLTDLVTFYNLRRKFVEHFSIYGHLTMSERAIFNDLISKKEFAALVEKANHDLMDYVNQRLGTLSTAQIEINLINDDRKERDHFVDPLHVTRVKSLRWDSKADGNHTHYLDDRIFIHADDVVDGTLSMDRLPDSVKHIIKRVNTHAEKFALTIDDVQNGDTVYVAEDIYPELPAGMYLVYDDTKLMMPDGYIFYRCRMLGNIDYDDIRDKPDTLVGYGITNGLYVHKDPNDDSFIFPFNKMDRSFNWLVTFLFNKLDTAMTNFLTHLQKLLQDWSISGIRYRNNENWNNLLLIKDKWDPYRLIHGNHIEDMDQENIDKKADIERMYAEAYQIMYN